MSKNIVLFLDGTGNKFGDTNTNVVKLNDMLDKDTKKQVRFYQNGLGTMGEIDWLNPIQKLRNFTTMTLELAFGDGVFSNLKEAYAFLMDTYEPGDKLFIFGFSRGAYTAKALCALLHQFGLIEKGQNHLIDHMFSIVKSSTNKDFKLSAKFKKIYSIDCKPHFLGIWDAVSSVGTIFNPKSIPYTFDNPSISIIRHAIAIDEKRAFFPPHLSSTDNKNQDTKEVYFAGVHSDVGGGYLESESGLAKISLEWMIEEAQKAGLLFNQQRKDRILGVGNKDYVKPNHKSQQHDSMTFMWKIAEFIPKKLWNSSLKRYAWHVNFFRSRYIPENSTLHQSVIDRINSNIGYAPSNIPKNYKVWQEHSPEAKTKKKNEVEILT